MCALSHIEADYFNLNMNNVFLLFFNWVLINFQITPLVQIGKKGKKKLPQTILFLEQQLFLESKHNYLYILLVAYIMCFYVSRKHSFRFFL